MITIAQLEKAKHLHGFGKHPSYSIFEDAKLAETLGLYEYTRTNETFDMTRGMRGPPPWPMTAFVFTGPIRILKHKVHWQIQRLEELKARLCDSKCVRFNRCSECCLMKVGRGE